MVQTSQFIFTIKLLFLCLGLVSKSQQISALRLGKDSEDNDIGIVYSDGNYYVIYKETFQYRNSDFTFCFRHRPVEDVSSTNCQLGNSTGPFDCISYDPSTNGYNQWAMDSDYQILQDQSQIKSDPISKDSVKYGDSFALDGVILKTNESFNFVSEPNAFYEVISAGSAQVFMDSPADLKKNFISTFYSSQPLNNSDSDNLLMQRQAVCFRQDKFYHLLFLGAVVRDDINVYIQALVSYDSSKKNFKIWGGISYSKDHTSRDMVGIDHMFGNVFDLFSLYASAPYSDISDGIMGENNCIVLGSSAKNLDASTWIYFTQFYRDMKTGDSIGDETLRFKIKNQYCFVSYVLYSEQDFTSSDDAWFLEKNRMHQYLNCFTPDLTLLGQYRYSFLLLGAMGLIFFIL